MGSVRAICISATLHGLSDQSEAYFLKKSVNNKQSTPRKM